MQILSATRTRGWPYIQYFLLPLIIAVFPALFHYANNSAIAPFSDILKLLAIFAGIAVLLYILFCLVGRQHAVQAANALSMFLLFFHTYGLVFNGLRSWDVIRVDYYTLLPLFILLGLQLAWLVGRLKFEHSTAVWQGALIIVGTLLVFNLFKTVSTQVRTSPSKPIHSDSIPGANAVEDTNYPDIYYFLFDEMAGFDVMRQYFQYNEIDDFVQFLDTNGFYVAEQSRGHSIETLYEMGERFNYEVFPPYDRNKKKQYHESAANGRIFQYFRSLGYTTVAFDEKRSAFGFPAGPAMDVDYLYEEPSGALSSQSAGTWDEFTLLVLDNTMLQPLIADIKLSSPLAEAEQHKNMIFFTMDRVPRLDDIPKPKFVYVHLMLPHLPFMFREDGSLYPQSSYYDWNNYLGNYQFSLTLIERVITDIMASADPAHPPVIIIQSDHGARNIDYGLGVLPNYTDDYKTQIVNALFLPGCNNPPLSQDMDPINTFPIIFNCYFDAEMQLVK